MGKNLITGASGNVERYVAQYALENGQEITVAGTNPDRFFSIYPFFNKEVAILVAIDFVTLKNFVGVLCQWAAHDCFKIVKYFLLPEQRNDVTIYLLNLNLAVSFYAMVSVIAEFYISYKED